MSMINENVKKLAPDLTKGYPASPYKMLAGYVVAARCVDKCRAVLAGTNGEYLFDCPLDNMWLGFAGIKGSDLKEFVATGANNEAVAKWVEEHAQKRPRVEIIKWNNQMRYKRISELPDRLQEFLEDHIPAHVIPRIGYYFDIYELDERRITL